MKRNTIQKRGFLSFRLSLLLKSRQHTVFPSLIKTDSTSKKQDLVMVACQFKQEIINRLFQIK